MNKNRLTDRTMTVVRLTMTLTLLFGIALYCSTCSPTDNKPEIKGQAIATDMDSLIISDNFNFGNFQDALFSLKVVRPDQTPLSKVVVKIFDATSNPSRLMLTGMTDSSGLINFDVQLPAHINEVMAKAYLPDGTIEADLYMTGSNVEHTFVAASSSALMSSSEDDSDGDGVDDNLDAYPNDADRAFDNFFPSEGAIGCIAFEDLWNSTGDYDFNDLVIQYNFNLITNASGKVKTILAKFFIQAVGADYHNGFGFEMPINQGKVTSVEGIQPAPSYTNYNGKNLETGQGNKSVIILFGDTYDLINPNGSDRFVNTVPGNQELICDTLTLTVELNKNKVTLADLGAPPFNPFLIINGERGREVHPAGYQPTSLVNHDYFGQNKDNTDISGGVLYKTENNLPWGLIIPYNWRHGIETEQILKAYPLFQNWAESDGASNSDWYVSGVDSAYTWE